MATFGGKYGADIDYIDETHASTNLQSDDGPQIFGAIDLSANDSGALTDNLPISQPGTALTGSTGYSGSGNDYFYHRFHIVPSFIDAGNVVSPQTESIIVWNGHLEPMDVDSVVESGEMTGVSLTPPSAVPFTFASLEEETFTLDIDTEGDSLIDGLYTFTFSSGEELTLAVSGQRVFVWSFKPNWNRGVEERLEWMTDVMASHDGTEQRMSLRAYPRRVFSYEFMIDNNADRRKFEALLFNWGARQWMFPIWTESNKLGSTLPAASSSFTLDRKSSDWQDEGYALLFLSAFQYEVVRITTISGMTVNLNNPTVSEWPAGTLIYPCFTALLNDKQELTRFTGQTELGRCTMRLIGHETVAAPSPTLYRSHPVIEDIPDWSKDITNDYLRKLQVLDFRTGALEYEDQAGMPFHINSHHWTMDGKDEIDSFRQFLYARAGKHKVVWLPTFTPDIELLDTIGLAETNIDVEHGYITQHLWGHKNRRDIMIELVNGTKFYRRVTNVIEVDADTERMSISSALGQEVTVDDIRRICWMAVARLDTDNVTLLWKYDDWVECSANWRTVRDDI